MISTAVIRAALFCLILVLIPFLFSLLLFSSAFGGQFARLFPRFLAFQPHSPIILLKLHPNRLTTTGHAPSILVAMSFDHRRRITHPVDDDNVDDCRVGRGSIL